MSLLLLFGGGGGAAPITGSTAITLGNVVSTTAGGFGPSGTVAKTLGNVVPTASGQFSDVGGSVARTLGNVTSTAAGISNASVTGLLAVTLGNISGVADTEGYTVPGARITFIGEHRLALPPPPDIEDPKVGDYLEYLRQHTQDAYNRLADDLARLQRDARAVADIANTAVYQSDSITIENSITNGDIIIEDATDQELRAALETLFSVGPVAMGANEGGLTVNVSADTSTGATVALGGFSFAGTADTFFMRCGVNVTLSVISNPCTVELQVFKSLPSANTLVGTAPKIYLPTGIYPVHIARDITGLVAANGSVDFRLKFLGVGGTSDVVHHASGGPRYSITEFNTTANDLWDFAAPF